MKPTRRFSADVGQASTYDAGPDAIEQDLDKAFTMFSPEAQHSDASPGGIGEENLQPGAVSDAILGNRTVDQTIATAYANIGPLTTILSWFAKVLRGIVGGANWYTAPTRTLEALNTVADANEADIENKHTTHRTAAVLDHPDNSVTDAKIGNRTVDSATAVPFSSTGSFTQILSWLARVVRVLNGRPNWYDSPPRNMVQLDTDLTALTSQVTNESGTLGNQLTTHKSSDDHDGRYYTEQEVTNLLTVKADTDHNHDARYYTEGEIDQRLSDLVLGEIGSSLTASSVNVADAEGHFAAGNVEAVLHEIHTGKANQADLTAHVGGSAAAHGIRTYLELDANSSSFSGSKKADVLTQNGQCVFNTTSTQGTASLTSVIIDSLRLGNYSLGVRVRSASTTATGGLLVEVQKNVSGSWTNIAGRTIAPTEFITPADYKTFWIFFNYGQGKAQNNQLRVVITLIASSSVFEIALDSIVITPVGIGLFTA